MNRRELAKNGFVGLCGALLGNPPEEEPKVFPAHWQVYNDGSCDSMSPDRRSVMMVADGYSLSDGTEIKHG